MERIERIMRMERKITIRIPMEELEGLLELRNSRRRNVSDLIREFIDEGLNRERQEGAGQP